MPLDTPFPEEHNEKVVQERTVRPIFCYNTPFSAWFGTDMRNLQNDFERATVPHGPSIMRTRELLRAAADSDTLYYRRFRKYPDARNALRTLKYWRNSMDIPLDTPEKEQAYFTLRHAFITPEAFSKRSIYLNSEVSVGYPVGIKVFGVPVYIRAVHPNALDWERHHNNGDFQGYDYSTYLDWISSLIDLSEWETAFGYPISEFLEKFMRSELIAKSMWIDDDNKVNYIERFGSEPGALKWQTRSWSKFLKMLRHKYNFRVTDDEIAAFSEVSGVAFAEPKYTLKLVSGNQISQTYNESYFGSCMHNNRAPELYDEQPDGVVSILRCEDEEGGLAGRALVWHDVYDFTREEGDKYTQMLDRIYPSNGGPHIDAMIKHAQEQGWLWKETQSIHGQIAPSHRKVRVKVKPTGNWPYMDTFHYSKRATEDDGWLKLYNFSSSSHDTPWDNTGNRNPGVDGFDDGYGAYCTHCDELHNEDDMYGTEDGLVCDYCFHEYYVETIDHVYVHRDDSDYSPAINVRWDLYCHASDLVYSEVYDNELYVGRYNRNVVWEPVEITRGQWEGQYANSDDVHVDDDGEVWWYEDPERPEETE